MPAKRKATKKAKATEQATPQEVPESSPQTNAVESDAMQTDEPQASSSSLAATPSVEEIPLTTVTNIVESAEHAVETAAEKVGKVVEAAGEFVEEMGMAGVEEANTSRSQSQSLSSSGKDEDGGEESRPKLTLEERRAKMDELRKKLAQSSKANRASLVREAANAKLTARELTRLDRQRKLAEVLRTKADAEERGEDVERKKNWEYTIEENDEWEKKLARKRRRADFEFHDDAHAARRRYKKDLDTIKPDLEAYNKQKAIAMGLNPGTLVGFSATGGASSSEVQAVSSEEQRVAAENLYRDANTLIYGDNKPTEEIIDRVVSKINNDIDKKAKFHRKRLNEEEGDITYINEHNRVFNKKIARYYDKYTAEIRASFERGTAL